MRKNCKKIHFTRRAQRRKRTLKKEKESQKRWMAQSVLDRDDRRIGFSQWQQKRVTLSQLILPKPSHSGQNESAEVKVKKAPKSKMEQLKPVADKGLIGKKDGIEKEKKKESSKGQMMEYFEEKTNKPVEQLQKTTTTKMMTNGGGMAANGEGDGRKKREKGKGGGERKGEKDKDNGQSEGPKKTVGEMNRQSEGPKKTVGEMNGQLPMVVEEKQKQNEGNRRDEQPKEEERGTAATGGDEQKQQQQPRKNGGQSEEKKGEQGKGKGTREKKEKGRRGETGEKQGNGASRVGQQNGGALPLADDGDDEQRPRAPHPPAAVAKETEEWERTGGAIVAEEKILPLTNGQTMPIGALSIEITPQQNGLGQQGKEALQQGGGAGALLPDADEAPLTKCSVDSGLDSNGAGGGHGSRESSPNSPSRERKGKRMEQTKLAGTDSEEKPEGVTKFERKVYELVSQVSDRLEVQTVQLAGQQEMVAVPQLEPLKVEPLNLERIQRLAERKAERKPRVYKLLDADIQFCQYMIETHGDNFEAMNLDPMNVYGDSSSSIQRKLRIYRDYLKQSAE